MYFIKSRKKNNATTINITLQIILEKVFISILLDFFPGKFLNNPVISKQMSNVNKYDRIKKILIAKASALLY